MATLHVWSGATGAANGTSWTDAYTTLQAALTAWTTSDIIYVHTGASSPHSESTSSASITFTASAASAVNRVPIWGVDKDNSDAPAGPSATDNVTNTGTGSFDIIFNLHASINRLRFNAVRHIDIDGNFSRRFNSCHLRSGKGAVGKDFLLGSSQGSARFDNCTFELASEGSGSGQFDLSGGSNPSGRVVINGGSVTGLSDSNMFNINPNTNKSTVLDIVGFDFTPATGESVLFGNNTGSTNHYQVRAIGCKLQSGVTVCNTPAAADQEILIINSDSGGAVYRNERYEVGGDVKTDTGVYHNNGWQEKTHSDTAQNLSHKYTPSSNCKEVLALEGMPLIARVGSTGSKTFTVEAWDGFTTALQDDEAWMEVFYLGTASSALFSVGTSRVTPGTTPANLASGTGAANWTGEPSGRSVKFAVTATVNQIGMFIAKVYLGKYEASVALYVDPLVTVS